MSSIAPRASSFDKAAEALDLGMLAFWFSNYPAGHCRRLTERVKLAAKLLGRTTGLQHSKALDAVAQAVRFPAWHHLSAYLAKGVAAEDGSPLPSGWPDPLSGALLLMVEPADDVSLPPVQVDAFERFGEALAMLTDSPKQVVLDGVSAPLCGGRTWVDVRSRSPLKAKAPLYSFVVPEIAAADDIGGSFSASSACSQLTEELDDKQDGFDTFAKSKKREVRKWVEDALAAQPGFLEGGLALAWMQHGEGQAEASSTVNRFIRQAEALIPSGYKGKIVWADLGNRFYHRLLWLRMKLHHEAGELPAAAKVARKQLKLNPNDNLGIRYLLPLMLLEQGDFNAANRALRPIDDEVGLTASAIKAFVAFSLGEPVRFRRELATALFTLPWLRLFMLNTPKGLPEGDDGIRGVQPALDTFGEFAWPAYGTVSGLRGACVAFLAEPKVRQAETELWRYWRGFWRKREDGTGTREGWNALVHSWTERVVRSSPAQ